MDQNDYSSKIRFRDNKSLQEKLIDDRKSGMSLTEICKKHPQYSAITYKRFFSSIGLKSTFDNSAEEYCDKLSKIAAQSWKNRDQDKKDKHIEHLRKLAEGQIGKPPPRPESWKENNLKHMCNLHKNTPKTMMDRYGVTNASYIPEVVQKRKETCFKNFGVSSYFKTPEFSLLPTVRIKKSKNELEILEWVKSLGYDAFSTREFGVEIDIYIPELKIGIEYNGMYWHSEKFKTKDHLLKKTIHLKAKDVNLIHIFEYEWQLRKEQVKSFLLSKLKRNTSFIHARKCLVESISHNDANFFLDQYHIIGKIHAVKECFGLKYDKELVAIAAISKHHRDSSKYVMSRFCVKTSISVSGGLSRLSKTAASKYGDIITWCDRRHSDGDGYQKAGWEVESVLKPDYFYTKGHKLYISKQSRKKCSVNTPSGMTEHEHAVQDGLLRVYDAGKIRLLYKTSRGREG